MQRIASASKHLAKPTEQQSPEHIPESIVKAETVSRQVDGGDRVAI